MLLLISCLSKTVVAVIIHSPMQREEVYFFANEIFMAWVGVILKPCRASLAAADCISFSNSTNAMSCLLGTSRTWSRRKDGGRQST